MGIRVQDRAARALAVNQVLVEFGERFVARKGLPYEKRKGSAIAIIGDATTDELGDLTGELGRIPSISVKWMLSKA